MGDCALEKTKEVILRDLETKPSVTFVHDMGMRPIDKLDEKFKSSENIDYIGEFDAFSFNGVESDIICCRVVSSTSLLQHCSRARRLLIIITDSNAPCDGILNKAANEGIIHHIKNEHLEDVEHPTVNDPNLKNEIGDETEHYGASYDEVVQHLITDGPDETALYRANKKVQLFGTKGQKFLQCLTPPQFVELLSF